MQAHQSGCSECLSSKAAGEQEPEAYPLGYVEDSCDLRTPLAGIMDSRLVGDDSGCRQPINTVLPECGRIIVKDAGRIRRQDPPRPHKHLSFQLPRSPSGKSGKGPEGFGRFGPRNDAF